MLYARLTIAIRNCAQDTQPIRQHGNMQKRDIKLNSNRKCCKNCKKQRINKSLLNSRPFRRHFRLHRPWQSQCNRPAFCFVGCSSTSHRLSEQGNFGAPGIPVEPGLQVARSASGDNNSGDLHDKIVDKTSAVDLAHSGCIDF